MNPILRIHKLSKNFQDSGKIIPVLQDVNLTVQKGKFISIIGPSGCGKSTLFHILANLSPLNDGSILIDGKNYKTQTCGYMFQDALLFEWKTVVENIMLGYQMKGITDAHAKTKAQKLVSEFGLQRYEKQYPATLSGGTKQRIALLRTIAYNKSLLLLDEPFGSLDAFTRTMMHTYLLEMWKKLKLTIILTTHDIREALLLSDDIYVLAGKPASIQTHINVTIPRPRNKSRTTSIQMAKLEQKLFKSLHRYANV
jgi:ABC-type nitrate/sulfonate/bicarbonate transport system ATPase subunit